MRAMIRLTVARSRNERTTDTAEAEPPKRGYRRIDWIELALAPVHTQLDESSFERLVSGNPRFRYTMLILTPGAQSYFHPTGCVLGQGPLRSSPCAGSPVLAAPLPLYQSCARFGCGPQ